MRPLGRAFYDRNAIDVARELIGLILIRHDEQGLVIGRIVESEAYLAENDSACHASRGKTPRNESMFGPPGHAYVYAIHSRWCLNVVTDKIGVASAVLLRAIEPLEGIDLMEVRRDLNNVQDLARGPGRLCQALNIDRRLDGWDLTAGEQLWICRANRSQQLKFELQTSARIGVTSAHDLPLRFFINGSRFVSGPRKFHRPQGAQP